MKLITYKKTKSTTRKLPSVLRNKENPIKGVKDETKDSENKSTNFLSFVFSLIHEVVAYKNQDIFFQLKGASRLLRKEGITRVSRPRLQMIISMDKIKNSVDIFLSYFPFLVDKFSVFIVKKRMNNSYGNHAICNIKCRPCFHRKKM